MRQHHLGLLFFLVASLGDASKTSTIPSGEVSHELLKPTLQRSDQTEHLTAPDGSVASSVTTRISSSTVAGGGVKKVEVTYYNFPNGTRKKKVTTMVVSTEYKGFGAIPPAISSENKSSGSSASNNSGYKPAAPAAGNSGYKPAPECNQKSGACGYKPAAPAAGNSGYKPAPAPAAGNNQNQNGGGFGYKPANLGSFQSFLDGLLGGKGGGAFFKFDKMPMGGGGGGFFGGGGGGGDHHSSNGYGGPNDINVAKTYKPFIYRVDKDDIPPSSYDNPIVAAFRRNQVDDINRVRREVWVEPPALQQLIKVSHLNETTTVCLNPELSKLAQKFADLSAQYGRIDHYLGGTSPAQRYQGAQWTGENLAQNPELNGGKDEQHTKKLNSSYVVDLLREDEQVPSKGHYATLVAPQGVSVGIGLAWRYRPAPYGYREWFTVQVFSTNPSCHPGGRPGVIKRADYSGKKK